LASVALMTKTVFPNCSFLPNYICRKLRWMSTHDASFPFIPLATDDYIGSCLCIVANKPVAKE